jgi:hypothetical protein
MYEELNDFEKALSHFGTRVEIITAMEMAKKLSPEDAFQMIKAEMKEMKKVRKQSKEDPSFGYEWTPVSSEKD